MYIQPKFGRHCVVLKSTVLNKVNGQCDRNVLLKQHMTAWTMYDKHLIIMANIGGLPTMPFCCENCSEYK